jgi:bifunctional dethiobiotin synthetase / adenosylmethionine---8-amino-7-oxononanoate aminotransferase
MKIPVSPQVNHKNGNSNRIWLGYSSTAATGLQKKLLGGSDEFKIHVRVLGNVLYVMASQTSKPETLRSIEKTLLDALT